MGAIPRRAAWMTLVLATSCVIPIPASPDNGDGGILNADPVIVKGSPMDFPGPITLRPGEAIALSVTLRDANVLDTLYVRVFKNYQLGPQGALQDVPVINDEHNGTEERTQALQTQNWCAPQNAGQTVQIDVVVADRPFDPTGLIAPPYKASPNGKHTEKNYLVTCAQP